MLLTIGELAIAIGVSVVTLRRWDKANVVTPQLRTAGGHRRYLLADVLHKLGAAPNADQSAETARVVVGDARVSYFDEKQDLVRQKERLEAYLDGEPRALIITDLGSGLNFKKRGLSRLISLILSGRVERPVVTHKDRLLRFGFELIEQLVVDNGGRIEILEDVRGNEEVEFAKDVLTIITVFSAKLYGRRAHQKKQQAA
jgi:predicted site-specific integrase-resolvase